jgi:transposase
MKHHNRTGRPKLADETCRVQLTLPSELYDRIYLASRRDRVSVPELLRKAAVKLLLDQRGSTLSV